MSDERSRDVLAVDAFLSDAKTLVGTRPQWKRASRPQEWEAIWLIEDAAGVQAGQLRFRVHATRRDHPSLSVLFRGRAVWRVHLTAPGERKLNPPWAASLGLPAHIRGPHAHEWPDHRDYLLTGTPVWNLPCHRPIGRSIRRLTQVTPWLADRIRLTVLPDQREFDVPLKTDLFDQ